jgi:hypothetical protein
MPHPHEEQQQLDLSGLSNDDLTQLLVARQIQLVNEQLTNLQRAGAFQEDIEGALVPFINIEEARGAAAARQIGGIQDTQADLLSRQMDIISSGNAATPEQIALINQSADAAIAAGETDIDRFVEDSFRVLRDELAPSLGLRPGDTPVLDRGGLISRESVRQRSGLSNIINSARARDMLNFPLASNQLTSQTIGAQQSLTESMRQFQEQLLQQAFLNRQTLTNQGLTGSLGLAGSATPNIAGSTAALTGLSGAQLTSNAAVQAANIGADAQSGFGLTDYATLAGGVGGLLTGISNFYSSKKIKDVISDLDGNAVLAAIKRLPIEIWKYKGDNTPHVGTYAEDFQEGFGLGDGKSIPIVDIVGVLTSGVKTLAEKIERMEGFGLAHGSSSSS